jgi:hypothetical protein
MSDIAILKEMLKDAATVTLINHHKRKKVVLVEPPPGDYAVTIYDLPDEDEVMVIKADSFPAPQKIFAGTKGECKRADFIVIADTDGEKVIIFIEMKAGKGSTEAEIIQQLQGSQCLIAYCREVGRVFWNQPNFLENYEYRFVSIKNIRIDKRPTRTPHKDGRHDRPDQMLKISSPNHLQFNHLIGG